MTFRVLFSLQLWVLKWVLLLCPCRLKPFQHSIITSSLKTDAVCSTETPFNLYLIARHQNTQNVSCSAQPGTLSVTAFLSKPMLHICLFEFLALKYCVHLLLLFDCMLHAHNISSCSFKAGVTYASYEVPHCVIFFS
jgi:hypothetical protein